MSSFCMIDQLFMSSADICRSSWGLCFRTIQEGGTIISMRQAQRIMEAQNKRRKLKRKRVGARDNSAHSSEAESISPQESEEVPDDDDDEEVEEDEDGKSSIEGLRDGNERLDFSASDSDDSCVTPPSKSREDDSISDDDSDSE